MPPRNNDTVIRMENLTLGYGEKVILKDVNTAFPRAKITCIVGGSGCGKSTIIKAVIGLIRPMSGVLNVLGHDLLSLSEKEREQLMTRIGVMFQGGAMLNSITVGDNIAVPLIEHTTLVDPIIKAMVMMKLELVGLGHAANLLPSELSGGMLKRAAIARALALDPEILICDEPSAGLDPVTSAGLDQVLINLKETFGLTVLVVTHELGSIETIADHIVMAGNGGLICQGPFEEVRKSPLPEVRTFFGRSADEEGRRRRTTLAYLEG